MRKALIQGRFSNLTFIWIWLYELRTRVTTASGNISSIVIPSVTWCLSIRDNVFAIAMDWVVHLESICLHRLHQDQYFQHSNQFLYNGKTEAKQQRAALIRNANRAAKKGFLEKDQHKKKVVAEEKHLKPLERNHSLRWSVCVFWHVTEKRQSRHLTRPPNNIQPWTNSREKVIRNQRREQSQKAIPRFNQPISEPENSLTWIPLCPIRRMVS